MYDSNFMELGLHLLKPGLVDVGKGYRQGQILLTENSLFALKSGAGGHFLLHFGLVGALVGLLIESIPPPGQMSPLNDAEVQSLSSAAQRAVRGTELLVKIPFAGMSVTNTRMGFLFSGAASTVNYAGYFRKKGIRRFLEAQGVAVKDS